LINIPTLFIRLKTDQKYDLSPHLLREYLRRTFGGLDIGNLLEDRHEHYPRLQVKVLGGYPCIQALGETARSALWKILPDINEFDIRGGCWQILEKDTDESHEKLGPDDHFHSYEFVTPWIGLNEQNYLEFQYLRDVERDMLLNRLLSRNLEFISRDFDIETGSGIRVENNLHFLEPESIQASSTGGFQGNFIASFQIPNWLFIGQMTHRGFGIVRRMAD